MPSSAHRRAAAIPRACVPNSSWEHRSCIQAFLQGAEEKRSQHNAGSSRDKQSRKNFSCVMEFFHFFILNIQSDFLVSLLQKYVRTFVQARQCCTELQASKASSAAAIQALELWNCQKASDVPSITLINSHAVTSRCSCKGCQQVSDKCLLKLFESHYRLQENPSVLTQCKGKSPEKDVNVTVLCFSHQYSISEDHVKEVMLQFRGLSTYFIICHPE